MSTKIYDAYHFKEPCYPWNKLWEIQDRARENVEANIEAHYRRRLEDIVYTDPEYDKAAGPEHLRCPKLLDASQLDQDWGRTCQDRTRPPYP